MGQPLKVMFLMEDLRFGGTQKQTVALASRLNRNLFSPFAATLTGKTDLDADAERCGVPLYHMGRDRKLDPFFFLKLGKLLRENKPDILVPCTALPNIWGRIWGRLSGVPLIVGTCRGGGAPVRQHERFLWRLADHIVCNSRASIEAMTARGVPREKMTYIANGTDTERFSPDPCGTVPGLIACVARLAEDKDHETLIRAFGVVAKAEPEARLRLVGEGPLMDKLVAFVRNELEPAAARRVEFAGASAKPEETYREASVFALSSIRESQPNAILEAMSAGLPVCATAVGGIPQMINDGRDGLLSKPGDATSLAANILALLRDPEKAKEMGEAGRREVLANYSRDAMVKAHEELFLKLWNHPARIRR
ncbi:MAG: glycosyltransferase [Desulfovibrio sp.]|nr:glycosyltransferase [Desulfovibrio sp.]